jgi:hypothetical protein
VDFSFFHFFELMTESELGFERKGKVSGQQREVFV